MRNRACIILNLVFAISDITKRLKYYKMTYEKNYENDHDLIKIIFNISSQKANFTFK